MAAEPGPPPRHNNNIVVVGGMNPLIPTIDWLLANRIIEQHDADFAVESGRVLVSPDLTIIDFRTLQLQVQADRLQVSSKTEAETPMLLGDFVANVFTLLTHTPVGAIGLNHREHRAIGRDEVDRVLDRVAPIAPVAGLLPNIHMDSLTWKADRDDDYAGRVRITAEPSVYYQDSIYLDMNDHIELGPNGTGRQAAELVSQGWTVSLQRAEHLFESIANVS